MIVYGSPLSQPTRFVLWTCALRNLPFEFKRVDAGTGEHRTPEFLKMNPNAVFPVLREQSSSFTLFESNAIARYMSGDDATLYPVEPKTRALVEQWLDWKHGSLRQGCSGIVRRRVMRHMLKDISKHSMAQAFVEIKEEREVRQLLEALDILEKQLALTNLYIVGGTQKPTLADFAVFEEVEQLRLLPQGEEPPFGSNFVKYPNMVAWLNRLRQVPHYEIVHKDFNMAVQKLEQGRKKSSKI